MLDDTLLLVGNDVAQDGSDRSTIYTRRGAVVMCRGEHRFTSDRGGQVAFAGEITRIGLEEYEAGAREVHIRIDTTGIGAGLADILRGFGGDQLRAAYGEDKVRIFNVRFGSTEDVQAKDRYANKVTELYAVTGEILAADNIALVDPPAGLEQDLTGRQWIDSYRGGQWLMMLEPKSKFKQRWGRSPDHGDGCVMAVPPPEVFGVYTEVEYLVRHHHLKAATRTGLEWGSAKGTGPVCLGVDGGVASDGRMRLCVVVRGAVKSGPDAGRYQTIALALLFSRETAGTWSNPWQDLARLMLSVQAPWCVIQAEGDMWEPALDFASRVRDVPPPPGSHFRRTYLLRWRGTDARPAWRDKPRKEIKLKGEEEGYKFVVDWHRAHAVRGGLEKWRDGQIVCPPLGDLWADVPPDVRETGPSTAPIGTTVREACLGSIFLDELVNTGFRRGEGALELHGQRSTSFAVAQALADTGLERMLGSNV